MRSQDNAEEGDLSRPEADAYVRLEEVKFASELLGWTSRRFDIGIMATKVSAHNVPGNEAQSNRPFSFRPQGRAGVNNLSLGSASIAELNRNVLWLPFSPDVDGGGSFTALGRVEGASGDDLTGPATDMESNVGSSYSGAT